MSETPSSVVFDEQQAAVYDERFARLAPLRDSLHLLGSLVLERLPVEANVLCVGVGTGSELLALANRFPQWRFMAVEPSSAMLAVCRRRVAEAGLTSRCRFHHGYIGELPVAETFDAATSLLVSQFLVSRDERVRFFREIALRLRPGGWLISADLSSGESGEHYPSLLEMHRRMMHFSGVPEAKLDAMCAAYGRDVAVLPTNEIAAIMTAGGFRAPVRFLQHIMIHAWYAQRHG